MNIETGNWWKCPIHETRYSDSDGGCPACSDEPEDEEAEDCEDEDDEIPEEFLVNGMAVIVDEAGGFEDFFNDENLSEDNGIPETFLSGLLKASNGNAESKNDIW